MRLRLVQNARGQTNEVRKVVSKHGDTLVLKDHHKRLLTFPVGKRDIIVRTEKGFKIVVDGVGYEYELWPYSEEELILPEWDW